MFAEDAELIPAGLFTDTMRRAHEGSTLQPLWQFFDVNGPLFDRKQPKIELPARQIEQLYRAAKDFDWQDVRPEIFGTIFEQALSPVERHELGAHYTREADIERVIGPTIVEPWRERIDNLRNPREAEALIEQLKAFHILDPACGCGDFLYVAYREMKRLEAGLVQRWQELQRKVARRRADLQPPPPGPWFSVRQLHGIEINGFAAFLARVVLWIGEHLANRELGLDEQTLPLKDLTDTIVQADALLRPWPRPEGELAIIGNPPYLGVRKLRAELGDEYVERLFERFPANRAADLVTYWFTAALETLRPGERAGFVATNSIAQNESREASLDRVVAAGGTITDAWKSYPWPGEAAVHVSIVNWVMGPWEGERRLDGEEVASISPALTSLTDVTTARHLATNEGICFMGVTPGNSGFVLSNEERQAILADDPESGQVIRPYLIGKDVNRELDQAPTRWVVDFGAMEKADAAAFEGAMRHAKKKAYARKHCQNERKTSGERSRWWQFVRPRPELRRAIEGMKRVIVIPCVSPNLVVSRQSGSICFDHQLMVVALSTPYHFGVLQSALHSKWARARGSTLKGDLRYTNTTIFETFPFPLQKDGLHLPREVPATAAASRVTLAAKAFEETRAGACRRLGLGLTKVHNLLDSGEDATLTRAWETLNDAVTACYGFPPGTWCDEGETLAHLLALNRKIAAGLAPRS